MEHDGTNERGRIVGTLWRAAAASMIATAGGCYVGAEPANRSGEELSPDELEDALVSPDPGPTATIACGPQMTRFPVVGPHNIGYDAATCGGACEIGCPGVHPNSDFHDGIDVFSGSTPGAPLVAVADGTIVAVGEASKRSGLRVRLRDACGWEYYYGHLDSHVVQVGQHVSAGDLVGYMGNTGKHKDGSPYSVHLHFNVSLDGGYYRDQGGIDPTDLLVATSPTACGVDPLPPPADPAGEPPPQPPAPGCGLLVPGQVLAPGDVLLACSGEYQVQLQTDGNIVLRIPDYVGLWHSATYGTSPSALIMQDDGNLVLYGTDGAAIWHTHTDGHPGAFLAMQDDGNLVVYQGNAPLWNSGTNQ